jgi:hypothetical protein
MRITHEHHIANLSPDSRFAVKWTLALVYPGCFKVRAPPKLACAHMMQLLVDLGTVHGVAALLPAPPPRQARGRHGARAGNMLICMMLCHGQGL